MAEPKEETMEDAGGVAEPEGVPKTGTGQFIMLLATGPGSFEVQTNVQNWELDILRVAQKIRRDLGL